MIELQLFRVKVFPSAQGDLFDAPKSRVDILKRAIESKPDGPLWGNAMGHVGDVEALDNSGYYFRFGRTTKATLEQFHDGHFEDAEFETTPYTHVLLDVELEVVAIAKKTRLAQTTVGIANQLARLLNSCDAVTHLGARIEIAPIQDPEDFIKYVHQAYNISKFSMTFSRPNPWDANKDFVQPSQKALAKVNGEKGRIEMRGQDLRAEPLAEFARSAASTGDDASVRLKESQQTRPVTKHLRGRAVTVAEEELDTPEQKRGLLERLRYAYHKIRGSNK
jgi:hypothetical protein